MKQFVGGFFLVCVLVANVAAANQTWDGWVSDTQCGAKVNKECSKTCIEQGAELVFVTSDKNVIQVTNPDKLKGLEGDHIKLTGTLKNGMITVVSVTPIKGK
jgi:hypothetical protein